MLNADTTNKCNRLSIRKLLKAKKVNTRMTPHAQQNDESWARGHVVKQLKMKGSHIEDLEDNVTLQKNDKNPDDATLWSAALSRTSKEIG